MEKAAISVQAHAKLNLFLEVTGRRADGFHDIDSVFVELDLADTVRASSLPSQGGVTLLCDNPEVPVDGSNLAVRAALAVRSALGADAAAREGLRFHLLKRIPSGGGLGGGSSDAAAALRLANALWGGGLREEELLPLAAALGSDVPFFLRGGTCRCRGRGEIVETLPAFPEDVELGLALPPFPSSTARAYGGLPLPDPGSRRDPSAFIDAMIRRDRDAMGELAFNRFEASVFRALPRLGGMHADLEKFLRRPVRMSGSGSTLWFFAEKGWRDSAALASWADGHGVTLLSAHAAAGRTAYVPAA